MSRFLCAVLGVCVIGFGFTVDSEPVAIGGHSLEGFWVAMAGVAAIVAALFGASPGVGLRAAGVTLLTTAVLGFTSPLWLQHARVSSAERVQPMNMLAFGVLSVQGLFALGAAWRWRRPLLQEATWWLKGWRLAVAAVLLLACAAHVTLYAPKGRWVTFGLDTTVMVGVFVVAVLSLVAFATSISRGALEVSCDALRGRISFVGSDSPDTYLVDRRDGRLDRWLPWWLALFVLAFSGCCALFVFDRMPHIPDGIAYLFQAKTFAGGEISWPVPPAVDALDVYLMDVQHDRWFAVTPPGWPAALAVGVFFGLPWLVNPLLGALSIPLAHAIVRRLGGRGRAHVAALLLATSPWLLFLSASFMTHALSLFLVLAAWSLLLQVRDGSGSWRALMAGAALGWLFLVRPLDGVLIGGFTGIIVLLRMRPTVTLAFGLGCVVVGGLVFPYNAALTGDALSVPIQSYLDRLWYPGANRLGFGADVGNPPEGWGILDPTPGHGLRDVLQNTDQNLYNLNFELFGWCTGGLLLTVLHLLRGRLRTWDRLALALLALLGVVYNAYWFSGGPDFGARYWYLMIFPILWLSLRGLETLNKRLDSRFPARRCELRLAAVLLLLITTTLLVFLPWRIVARYEGYRGFHAGYRALQEDLPKNALVLVSTKSDIDYACAFLENDPELPADRPVFVRVRNEDDVARLRAAWPDRTPIRVQGSIDPRAPVRIKSP